MESNNNNNTEVCIFSTGTIIDGDVKVNANVRLEGEINGNVTCNGKLVMSKTAIVNGHISCNDLTSEGRIFGNVNSSNTIVLQNTATLIGDIQCCLVHIESGASFNGKMYYAQQYNLKAKSVKTAKSFLSGFAGILPFSLLLKLSNRNLFLPFYHIIGDGDYPHVKHLYPVKNTKQFENELDFLLKHFEPISLNDLKDIKNTGSISNKKPVFHLSFDDGLKECYETIAPILLRKGIPATFFLNSAFIDNKALMFRYKVSLCLHAISKISTAEKKNIEHIASSFFLRKNIALAEYTENLKIDEFALQYLGLNFNHFLETYQPYLNSFQISDMISNGFTFGSHSVDHPLYSSLTVEDQIYQTVQSQNFISDQFKLNYKVFAFPFTDSGVTKSFFNEIFQTHKFEYTFGGAGLKNDEIKFNLQRFPMEQESIQPVKNMVGSEFLYCILKTILNKNKIIRNK